MQYSIAQNFDCYLGIGANLAFSHQTIAAYNGQVSIKNSKVNFGSNIGIRMDYSLNEYFSLSSGLNYIYKSSMNNAKLHYLSLPFLIKFEPIENFSIDLGGAIERLIYANQDGENVTSGFFIYDIGIIGGINYKIFRALRISFKYYHGLKPFYNFYNNDEQIDLYHKSYLLMLEYNIINNKK